MLRNDGKYAIFSALVPAKRNITFTIAQNVTLLLLFLALPTGE